MSVSAELLDALKTALRLNSDYAAAPVIGCSQQMLSQVRQNRSHFSPEKVLFLCELADLDAVDWLLHWHRERAKCDKEKAVFDSVLARLAA